MQLPRQVSRRLTASVTPQSFGSRRIYTCIVYWVFRGKVGKVA
jgi:hypothetical protein